MYRFALSALVCLAGCGRIGFDERSAVLDGNAGSGDADAAGGGSDGDASGGGTGTFGTMQVGISSQNAGADRVWLSRFMLSEPALLQRLVAHFAPTNAQGSTVRGVVYADSAGTPTTLLARTDEVTLPSATPPTWVMLPLASPVVLPAGVYWLGTHNSTSINLQYQSTIGATRFGGDVYADGTDATYAGGATTYAMELSVYAEYTR